MLAQFLQGELAQISQEPSRAEKPPAWAESELNRAELSSGASLLYRDQIHNYILFIFTNQDQYELILLMGGNKS